MELVFSPPTLDKPDECNRGLFKSERLCKCFLTQDHIYRSYSTLTLYNLFIYVYIYLVYMIF